jgi:hypothetical protein
MIDIADGQPAPVSRSIVLLCRIMSALCLFAIALEIGALILMLAAPEWLNRPSPQPCTGICVSHHGETPDFRDPVYLVGHVIAVGVFIWALLSVRRSFINVEHGQFFAHRTIVGLRNLAIGVLAYMTLEPLTGWLAKTLHALSQQHGEISILFGVSDDGLLMVIFTGAVIAITVALAHAARVAEENASFV